MIYRIGAPPNLPNLQAPQRANGPHMTEPGASDHGKSISHLEVSSRSIEFLIILPIPQSSQSSSYHDLK
jgi:hypothetical protein